MGPLDLAVAVDNVQVLVEVAIRLDVGGEVLVVGTAKYWSLFLSFVAASRAINGRRDSAGKSSSARSSARHQQGDGSQSTMRKMLAPSHLLRVHHDCVHVLRGLHDEYAGHLEVLHVRPPA